jgi:hypothetical protein
MFITVWNFWCVFLFLAIIIGVLNRKLYQRYQRNRHVSQMGKLRPKNLFLRAFKFILPPIKSDMSDRFKTSIMLQYIFISFSVFAIVAKRL